MGKRVIEPNQTLKVMTWKGERILAEYAPTQLKAAKADCKTRGFTAAQWPFSKPQSVAFVGQYFPAGNKRGQLTVVIYRPLYDGSVLVQEGESND